MEDESYLTYQKLKEELIELDQNQNRIISEENHFFQNACQIEDSRHQKTMNQINTQHSERMANIKQQEVDYKRKLYELNTSYQNKKKVLDKQYQRKLKRNFSGVNQCAKIYDASFIKDVINELKILQANRGKIDLSHKSEQLKVLADHMDAHFQLVHFAMNKNCFA